jgi:chromosome segregation and condensation protein ScpB
LRKATSCLARERLEAAYAYLLEYPLLGLAVMPQGDEFLLVTGVQVAASVERHLNAPRPSSLSGAATQVLTIVAYASRSARPASRASAAPAATALSARCCSAS